ncbi:hypothetical protein HH214_17575 [Mucilaginibacter robiniae]|uniref:Nucleotide-diphospho-sugar transferase domain-containing protein n=1 Tax=Mucilaginibacter robiniae TaxID=2728022 RepID=A0A7L5E6Z1_9SPHI|nr:hypothetical protein [Mucilaginibacter robiniae]QJD97554.1 hypothetical protein HH214_17575 [Mucilaginibacter robiniae]
MTTSPQGSPVSKNIVFLSHGSKNLHYEVIFCLYTLYHHINGDFSGLQIVIYTDDDSLFKKYLKDFPVHIEVLTSSQITEYRKPDGYVHRVKTCVMKHCMDKYPADMVFLDGDTFFTKNPWPLFNKITKDVSVMNIDEYDLIEGGDEHENSFWLELRKVVRSNTFVLNGQEIKIPLTARMWNSGFTGISKDNAYLINDVLDLIDQLYKKGKIFHIEQYALSYVLQNYTQIIDSEDYIVHYFKRVTDRKLFDYHVSRFLKANKNLPIGSFAKQAVELSYGYDKVTVPSYVHLYDTISLRWRNIRNVTLKGRI